MNLFVAGTDTSIGKTVVSAILCLKFKLRYWKPVQSGHLHQSDSHWVAERIGQSQVLPEAYRLSAPLSPHASAQVDKIEIDPAKIINQLPQKESIVIEGAGGLLVPLNSQTLYIDLLGSFQSQVLIVAQSKLGVINHALLSIEALRLRNICPKVILVGEPNIVNSQAIERFGGVEVLGPVPFLSRFDKSSLIQAGSHIRFKGDFDGYQSYA